MSSNFSDIYFKSSHLVLGFHGCEKSTALKILNSDSEHLKKSTNDYDWLGEGIYFWQNDPLRALEWAKRHHHKISEPFVLGAVIDLGRCLNLNEREGILLVKAAYEDLKKVFAAENISLNEEYHNEKPDEGGFDIMRPLDCLVINHLHKILSDQNIRFDSVVSYFQEGADAFEGSSIKEKSHVQICVVNTDCIKGYFLPRRKE